MIEFTEPPRMFSAAAFYLSAVARMERNAIRGFRDFVPAFRCAPCGLRAGCPLSRAWRGGDSSL